MFKEFKAFLLRGNLIDLAVAVVIGAAFTQVVNAFTKGIFTPLLAAIFGKGTQFNSLNIKINHQVIAIGAFINEVITFVLVAAVIFFFVVKPANAMMARLGRTEDETPMVDCPACLSKVPEAATKCAYCTSELSPAA